MARHKEGSGLAHLQNIRGPQRADVCESRPYAQEMIIDMIPKHNTRDYSPACKMLWHNLLWSIRVTDVSFGELVSLMSWNQDCVNIGRETLLDLCSQARMFPTALPCQLCGALSLQGANLWDLRIIQSLLVKQPHVRPPAITGTSTQSFLGAIQFYNIPLEFF